MRSTRTKCAGRLHGHVAPAVLLCTLLWCPPIQAFDTVLQSARGELTVHIQEQDFALGDQQLTAWIQRSIDVVTSYFDGFPGGEAYLAITGGPGKGVMNGIALGNGAAIVNVKIGHETSLVDLKEDWVLVHELAHLAFPKVQSRHHWAEEGLAVYVESVARVQAGDVTTDTLWRHFMEGMPNGLPRQGETGLDSTATWGSIYWGGALFYLLADIDIIRRSKAQYTLRDSLRAVVHAGLSIRDSRPLTELFLIGDRATGNPSLMETYAQVGLRALDIDLPSLWRRLGVRLEDGAVIYDDDAPWAYVRQAITRP